MSEKIKMTDRELDFYRLGFLEGQKDIMKKMEPAINNLSEVNMIAPKEVAMLRFPK